MNYLQKNFVYLSQLIGARVVDSSSGRKVGKVVDVAAGIREMYPRVTALIVRRGVMGARYSVPLRNIHSFEDADVLKLENNDGVVPFKGPAENEILLCDTFWDKQVVDMSGSKVVRVNDLHLLREYPNLWVVHMDIGFKGLIRRLGWSRFVEPMIKWLFSYELKDRFISWKFVQPVPSERGGGILSLKTPVARLSELHPADLADILIDLGTDERTMILQSLGHEAAANTLKELPLKMRIQTADLLPVESFARMVRELPVDEAVDLLANLPKKKVSAVLGSLPDQKAVMVRELLEMSEHVAGSLLTIEYAWGRVDMTAGHLLGKITTEMKGKESIYYVYILDNNNVIAGVVTLRQLLTVPPDRPVQEFMRRRVVKVRTDTEVKKVARIFYKYDFTVVPVVDRQNRMQGIIGLKDALESVFPEIREESEE